ncbi:Lipoprotein-releasing system ATP-binding protein LolD [Roseivivax sp. THAF40]|uniref:ABC transporter ATP-binding protein n=1 Tax=unclassified Roseivivax TaxID=2639302 RepID=UPI0012689677|nr:MULTISPECIES: ABC transporter ATP-binding protein [unclassified Roseivivax]QFS81722.1 Lipoprotein-releasing system ATP-binding protein LolD [Roseivivax sp. THAF197b]QFT45522.1 Lipoprotein-releasing system ATP-binding protein LolD [Roseivivax sp. THAF40]
MIDVDSLQFSYPGDGFTVTIPRLAVAKGEKLAVVGPSGTGKTTLLNLLSGIAVPDAGRVTVDGQEIGAMGDGQRRAFRASRIGFVFQNFALLDYLTARENILYPYRIGAGLRLDAEARARAATLAEACGIGDKIDRRPAALSQGEQQRVAICRALITEPALILADEATGNLDPATKSLILDLLFARADAAGATLLAVTHDHELLPRFDRVVDFADFRAVAA